MFGDKMVLIEKVGYKIEEEVFKAVCNGYEINLKGKITSKFIDLE